MFCPIRTLGSIENEDFGGEVRNRIDLVEALLLFGAY